jgi:organic hydroperoxide reductase OsmC/OhrA
MNTREYNVGLAWEGGRKGLLFSPEITGAPFNAEGIEVATPPQFKGGIPGVWSPEHLFTAAITSCLMTTFLAIAENFKLKFDSFSCNARGKLELVDGSWVMSEVILTPLVNITDENQRELAGKVLIRAEKACLISNSVKSRVTMEPTVRVTERLSTLSLN